MGDVGDAVSEVVPAFVATAGDEPRIRAVREGAEQPLVAATLTDAVVDAAVLEEEGRISWSSVGLAGPHLARIAFAGEELAMADLGNGSWLIEH